MPERTDNLAPENISTLDRLVRSIDLAEGFALFFARCNVPALRSELMLVATQQLAALGVEIVEVAFEDESANVRERLRLALEAADKDAKTPIPVEIPALLQPLAVAEPPAGYTAGGKRAVFVTGLEYGIPYDQPNARILAELNLGRDAFPRDVSHPLVIWLPDYAVTAVARFAPDFWAWRSGVFEFETGEAERSAAFEQSIWRDRPWHDLTNLTPEVRLLRRHQLESLLDDYRDLPDAPRLTRERADILDDLGHVCAASQEFPAAIDYYKRALALYRQTNDRDGETTVLDSIGYVYSALGDQRKALNFYEQARSIYQQTQDRRGEAAALNSLAGIYADLSDQYRDLKHHEQTLSTFFLGPRQANETAMRDSLNTVDSDVRRARQATNYAREALEYSKQSLLLLDETEDQHALAVVKHNLGKLFDVLGTQDKALPQLERLVKYVVAMTQGGQVGEHSDETIPLQSLELLDDGMANKGQALEMYEEALLLFREVGDQRGEATTLKDMGSIYAELGDRRKALASSGEALPIFQKVGDRRGEATTLNNLGSVHSALGNKRQALTLFEQALSLYRQVGDRWGEEITHYNLAMVYQTLGDLQRAEEELKIVVELDAAIEHPDLASDRAALERIQAKRAGLKAAK